MTAASQLQVETIGNGPDIVFFHGWGMNSAVWLQTLGVLSRNYRVSLIDFPGFGKNIEVPCDQQLDTLTDCILPHVPKDAVIVAWSMGGLVAMNIALRCPGYMSKLVLIASNAQFVVSDTWSTAMRAEVLDGFVENLNADYRQTLQRFLMLQARGGDNAKETIRALKQRLYQYGEPDKKALKGGLQLLKNTRFVTQLAKMDLPVLLMFGKRDALVPVAAAQQMQQRFPNARLVTFATAAHAPFLSHFDEYIKSLRDFLAE